MLHHTYSYHNNTDKSQILHGNFSKYFLLEAGYFLPKTEFSAHASM